MISARQVLLAIQYLDPDPFLLDEQETEEISDEAILLAIQYLDPDLENPEPPRSQRDNGIFRSIQYLAPDLDRDPPVLELRWLRRIRRLL